jgi:hypothetical protein
LKYQSGQADQKKWPGQERRCWAFAASNSQS